MNGWKGKGYANCRMRPKKGEAIEMSTKGEWEADGGKEE
jgi:hypothetical protein